MGRAEWAQSACALVNAGGRPRLSSEGPAALAMPGFSCAARAGVVALHLPCAWMTPCRCGSLVCRWPVFVSRGTLVDALFAEST